MTVEFRRTGAVIQPATDRDLVPVAKLLQACDLPVTDLRETHLIGFLLARHKREVTAVVGLEFLPGASALLRSLAVHPNYRGEGLAAELIARIERLATDNAVDSLYLLTTTAERFFAAKGYRVLSRLSVPASVAATAEFQQLCPASARCMEKHLPQRGLGS